MKNKNLLLSLLALLVLMLACANPLTTPSSGQPANVETVVAATLSALTASPNTDSAAPSTPAPADSPSSLLPRSMYYLAPDGSQNLQVFRLERDGKTGTQITFEPSYIEDYDVSQADGSVVYLTNHQLFIVNADGTGRRMIYDAGPQDEVHPFATRINSMAFSPDGQTIAFGHQGLNLYSLASGEAKRVLEDKIENGNGFLFPEELYFPEMFFADGSKLILTLGYYEGASTGFYDLKSGTLTRLVNEQRAIVCCSDYSLSADGSTLFTASPSLGMFASGLWRVDTNTGTVTTLLYGDFDTNPAIAADNPFLAPDGQLYYFHAIIADPANMTNRPPLQLVRSANDGVTNWTVLRTETFNYMNEALWAPDASFVIVANGSEQIYYGGKAELYYTDGQKAMISLLPSVQSMKWGP